MMISMNKYSKKPKVGIGCGAFIFLLLINITIGVWSVSVILSWFGKSIPLLAEAIIGLIFAEISVPVAIVGMILRAFGVF